MSKPDDVPPIPTPIEEDQEAIEAREDAALEETIEESFPASDAPSSNRFD